MTRPFSPLVHFHSRHTGVSLELPVGFERAGGDESSATYAVVDDDGRAGAGDPIVRVQVVGTFAEADAQERRGMVTELADGMARSGGELLARTPGVVDEAPVDTVVLRRPDGVHVHATAVATGAAVLTVVASGEDAALLPTYDAMVASLRFVDPAAHEDTDGADWTTLTSLDLLVSARVPRGWEVAEVTASSFTVTGPESASGQRPVVTVEAGEPAEPGHAWFADFAEQVVPRLRAEVPGFEEIATERFALSSTNADVLLVRARRVAGDLAPTAQVQAWVWAGSTRMLVVSGSTLLEHEQRDLPVFETVVRSLRLLSPVH